MRPADSAKAFSLRIPKAFGFLVIQHKGVFVGPAGRGEGKGVAVECAAVHSRQVNQRSVAGSDRFSCNRGIGDLVSPETFYRVGVCLSLNRNPDDPVTRGSCCRIFGKIIVVQRREGVFADAVLKPARNKAGLFSFGDIPALPGAILDIHPVVLPYDPGSYAAGNLDQYQAQDDDW